jgi:integrase
MNRKLIMAKLRLKYVIVDRDRYGKIRYYFRRRPKPKIKLPGLPGSDEFMAAYKAALGEQSACEKSFEWLCKRYYASSQFQALEDYTQRRKKTVLDEICNITGENGRRLGSAPYAGMKRVHVRKLRDMKAETPEAANFRLKQISALYSWAIKNDLANTNPAEKLEKLGGGGDGYYTWTDRDVETFETYWPVGSRPRLAMAIMLYLGVRRSDAVLIGKRHESKDGMSVTFAQFKGRKKGAKLLTLPILPPLRAILNASNLSEKNWLQTAKGKQQSSNGFGNDFKEWCMKAGLPQCNCHGLRKIGAVRAAEAGASEHELMAMFGWDDASMARIYTRKAAQKKLAASGAAKVMVGVQSEVQQDETLNNINKLKGQWCPEEDSNLHGFHHWYLKPARLPIPPSGPAPNT